MNDVQVNKVGRNQSSVTSIAMLKLAGGNVGDAECTMVDHDNLIWLDVFRREDA